jgi:hypothetical protein
MVMREGLPILQRLRNLEAPMPIRTEKSMKGLIFFSQRGRFKKYSIKRALNRGTKTMPIAPRNSSIIFSKRATGKKAAKSPERIPSTMIEARFFSILRSLPLDTDAE